MNGESGLTRVGTDRDRDNPEEKRKCQCGTQHDHVSHHLGVFFNQHLAFRVHSGKLEDRRHRTHIMMRSHTNCQKGLAFWGGNNKKSKKKKAKTKKKTGLISCSQRRTVVLDVSK